MSARAGDAVVLRHTVVVPGAVRLPRRSGAEPGGAQAEAPASHADLVAQRLAAAQAEGFGLGHEVGFRSGNEAGQRAGYEEGLRRGTEAAREEGRVATERAIEAACVPLAEQAARMDALLSGMADAARDAWAAADEDVLALCYETLCRVVGDAACAPECVWPQVQQLLAASDMQGSIALYLHPADARVLDEARAEGRLPVSAQRQLRWQADPRVALGGCLLAGSGGGIDARLETILEQCKAALLQARAARSAARAGLEEVT